MNSDLPPEGALLSSSQAPNLHDHRKAVCQRVLCHGGGHSERPMVSPWLPLLSVVSRQTASGSCAGTSGPLTSRTCHLKHARCPLGFLPSSAPPGLQDCTSNTETVRIPTAQFTPSLGAMFLPGTFWLSLFLPRCKSSLRLMLGQVPTAFALSKN